MSNSQSEDTLDSRSTRRLNIVARVNAVCPHKDRCLLRNAGPQIGVQYAHLVPRALAQDDDLMNKLEWYWGMARRTIDLDTCYNMFPCGIAFHAMHDALQWGLLPSDDIVARYHNSLTRVHSEFYAERTNFPNIPNGNFSYRFLPLRDMENAAILRYLRIPTPVNPLGPSDTVTHYFPFDTMPLLTSHIHPKSSLSTLPRFYAPLSTYIGPGVRLLRLDLWQTVFNPPPGDSDGGDDDDDEDDPQDEDYSDEKTIPRRDGKRKKATTPPSPSTRSKRSRPLPKRGTLRAIRDCVPSSDRPLRVKEWVDKTQMALEAHPEPPSSPRNTDIPATSLCSANDCPAYSDSNVRVGVSDAETLFEIESCGHKRLLDGENPAAKKQKTSVDEFRSEGCHCVDS
ncbi:hypothetical protein CCMSSC00406_0001815 [Pleurotus cornucopiae]|uniref:Uncharacterized protein n=1 Tax=Pleurotus cornucopiae TaxID=5321 RepID=A0ACB7J4R0_PLECO|nr:hypothetical protein CCMSSC00406_0001815 [Pleurotus cornucopiae]